jgi:hypothetical protein
MLLQIVLITQSQSLLCRTKQRCAHLRTSRADC